MRTTVTAMAVVLVSGFVVNLVAGRSSFDAPLIVHVHAVIFMGWVAITVAQVWLAATGSIARHRLLGRLAVVYSLGILVLGPWITLARTQSLSTPFFFQPQHFLIANPLTLVVFFALFGAAIALRKRTDWHMRLQIGAFVTLMGPGVGRLIPMPLLTPYAFEIAVILPFLVPIIGMLRDWRVLGRVHPAWVLPIAGLVLALILARLIAFSPAGDAIYAAATAGTPAAGTDGRAFLPAP